MANNTNKEHSLSDQAIGGIFLLAILFGGWKFCTRTPSVESKLEENVEQQLMYKGYHDVECKKLKHIEDLDYEYECKGKIDGHKVKIFGTVRTLSENSAGIYGMSENVEEY